jgi:hypothetical protein
MARDRARNEGLDRASIGSILPPSLDKQQPLLEGEALGNVCLQLLVQDEVAWMVGIPDIRVERRTLEVVSQHELPARIGWALIVRTASEQQDEREEANAHKSLRPPNGSALSCERR